MSNSATVQWIYEAFGRGDVPAILSKLAEDVRWDEYPEGNAAQDAEVPWFAERHGRDSVGGFFDVIAGALEFHGFEPVAMLEGDGRVAALIRSDMSVRATGRRFKDDEIHLWTFGPDGLVTEFKHHVDTAKHIAASGVRDGQLAATS
jgi:ketosteroid isomerase-like protein